jgi:hypothetical protein
VVITVSFRRQSDGGVGPNPAPPFVFSLQMLALQANESKTIHGLTPVFNYEDEKSLESPNEQSSTPPNGDY